MGNYPRVRISNNKDTELILVLLRIDSVLCSIQTPGHLLCQPCPAKGAESKQTTLSVPVKQAEAASRGQVPAVGAGSGLSGGRQLPAGEDAGGWASRASRGSGATSRDLPALFRPRRRDAASPPPASVRPGPGASRGREDVSKAGASLGCFPLRGPASSVPPREICFKPRTGAEPLAPV